MEDQPASEVRQPTPAAPPKGFNIANVLGGGILGFVLLWFLYSFFFVSFFGPDIVTHVKDLYVTSQTPDETLADFSCGNVRLSVIHRDLADKGAGATIDWEGYAPLIRQLYTLTGYENGSVVFEIPTRGTHWVSPYDSSDLPLGGAGSAFVIDREAFAKMNAAPAFYREATAVIFDSQSGFTKERIEPFARCYAAHAAELDTVWQKHVAAFTAPGPGISADTFSCPDGHKVVLEGSGYARLDGVTQNIIGIAGTDGVFHPYDNDAYIAAHVGSDTVPKDKRTAESWASCKDSKGTDFPTYIQHLGDGTVYLD